jgi:CheY-like chemotaxis protein
MAERTITPSPIPKEPVAGGRSSPKEPLSDGPKGPVVKRSKVVVVDDEATIVRAVRRALKDSCDIPAANEAVDSLEAAFLLVKGHSPDIVISDKDFCHDKRAHAKLLVEIKTMLPETKVILFSGSVTDADYKVEGAAFDAIVEKPDIKILKSAVLRFSGVPVDDAVPVPVDAQTERDDLPVTRDPTMPLADSATVEKPRTSSLPTISVRLTPPKAASQPVQAELATAETSPAPAGYIESLKKEED